MELGMIGLGRMDRGYCLIIGGDDAAVWRLAPIFGALGGRVEKAGSTSGGVS